MEFIHTSSVILLLGLLTKLTVIETATRLDLTPRNTNKGYTPCVTKNNSTGKCVDWSYCNEHYEIEVGGNIADSELRSSDCPRLSEWCCADKHITKPPAPKQQPKDSPSTCIVTELPDCPWCVKLYRNGNDRLRLESGFFCLGTLIGTRVILTTATCMVQAQSQNLWAKIPNSVDPTANYTVKFRLIHPDYNSGTRENDLALLTIDPEPEWDGGSKGACLGLEANSLVGECVAAGIDRDENITMTPLIVAEGNCGRGSVVDASCGHAIGGDCSIIPGSPIMCRESSGPYMMKGVAKLHCLEDPPRALLNNLAVAAAWLNDRLKGTMGLMESNYMIVATAPST